MYIKVKGLTEINLNLPQQNTNTEYEFLYIAAQFIYSISCTNYKPIIQYIIMKMYSMYSMVNILHC